MKTFSFLKHHKLSIVLALALLIVQAFCELSLPTIMSDIVNTGIANGGITSTVPTTITEEDLASVKLFLTSDEQAAVDAAYTADGSMLTFSGSSEARANLEQAMAEAEMLAYQFKEGVPTSEFVESAGIPSEAAAALETQLGGTVDIAGLQRLISMGVLDPSGLVEARSQLVERLGDQAVTARAIEFVRTAESAAGVDVNRVQTDYLLSQGAYMLAYAGLAGLCAVALALNASRTAAAVARDLRHDLYDRVLAFSPAETSQFSAASLITRATNDVQQIQTVIVMILRLVLYAPVMGIGAIIRVVSFGDTGLQWVIAVAIVAISVAVGLLMGLTLPRFRIMQKLVDKNNLIAREIITGIMPIRAFGRSRHEEERYDRANSELTATYIFTNRAMAFMSPLMLIVMNVTSVAILWFGAAGVDAGTLQVGDLMAYMNYTIQVIISFMMLTMISVMLPRADVAAERVREVLAVEPSISEPASPAPAPVGGWTGELAFNDVSFAYPGSEANTLENVSFMVRPGETVGIIGSTGVGKSTLVSLIPRLFDATAGTITVDGVDVRDMGLTELRDLIGFVPQKGVLFSGTIADNIKYGDPALPDEAVERAAAVAQAAAFIEEKPEGYESAIAQGGSNVSGGQRQRLAIARAIAREPKILVFDDAFSALDYKTDAALRDALAHRAAASSVVIVAQRIATIMRADKIIVLDDGHVVGSGTHLELLESCRAYREIAESQLSPEELGIADGVPAPRASEKEGGER
ncbi:ABC transporter ATP-binding protein [Collinsella vaginalis]|uniref:ABC transporter ATP-binding protein n=1 Tax=Collinsella vaginalis TaxID=1870987 RepID=UPI000A26BEBE|nr:ABC transporter ATP-binding protein [Collinsella vaginalis]